MPDTTTFMTIPVGIRAGGVFVEIDHTQAVNGLPSHVMDHISTAPHLRAKFDHLPVKTGRIFKRQLLQSGVVVDEDIEKTVGRRRQAHMVAISVSKLGQLGLHAAPVIERGGY